MKTLVLNGRTYPAIEFDLNTMIDLEDMGVSFETLGKKPMTGMRAYASLCMNTDEKSAGKEIEQHILNGGDMGDIISVMVEQMNESDFFRHIIESQTETSPKPQKKTRKATTEA